MQPFVSTVVNKLDAKGRVSVPASFRQILAAQNLRGIYCIPSFVHPALDGFGEKTQEKIVAGIRNREAYGKRHLWWDAWEISAPIVAGLRALPQVRRAEAAGSLLMPQVMGNQRAALALYTEDDAWRALEMLKPQPFGESFEVAPGITVTFRPAGHILGSATVRVDLAGGPSIQFSGDLGRPYHPLLVPPSPADDCDHLVVESTYGDRKSTRLNSSHIPLSRMPSSA